MQLVSLLYLARSSGAKIRDWRNLLQYGERGVGWLNEKDQRHRGVCRRRHRRARCSGLNFFPPKAKEGHSYPDCYCTNRGQRVEMGKMSCLRIGSQEFTARCGMSLNNPAWRDMTPGCTQPMSQAEPGSEFLEPA
jgi:hypothetical protein